MQKIDLHDIARLDLGLAITFVAIWRERSVSRAAQRLSLSQPTVSSALARLREVTADPLFVRTGGMMRPTPRAEQMAADVEAGVGLLGNALLARPAFAPETSRRRFTLGMSDDLQLAMGPALSRAVAERAPGVSLVYRQSNRRMVEAMAMGGEADLFVVTSRPRRSAMFHEEVAQGAYACLLDPTACGVDGPLDLDAYLCLPHVLVSFSGREGIVDAALSERGLSRRVQTALTHFAALPPFLVGRRAVATLPAHAASTIAGYTILAAVPVPVDLGRYEVSIAVRPDLRQDPEIAWLWSILRHVVAKAFSYD